jgi:hypothetical protein
LDSKSNFIQNGTFPPQEEMVGRFSKVLAGSLLFAYTVRITIPAVWLKYLSPFLLNFSGYFLLAFALLYILSKDVLSIYPVSLISISLISLTTLMSIDLPMAFSKWALWMLLFLVVGPFFRGRRALELRYLLWKWHRVIMIGVTVISFFWVVLGLPSYGKGPAGITAHSMLLGPFAALASIYALSDAYAKRKRIYLIIVILCILTCVISGSRSALIGMFIGGSFFPVLKLKSKTLRSFAYAAIAVIGLLAWSRFDVTSMDGIPFFENERSKETFSYEIAQKGLLNTREGLWKSRIEEFNDSPLWGIGIGIDRFVMSQTEYGTVVTEPGSSWLAILSMTGLIGAGGFFMLLIFHLKKVTKVWDHFLPSMRAEIAAIGIFWSIHAIAEGWIFAAGSILCLFFWLWLGYVANLGTLRNPKATLAS